MDKQNPQLETTDIQVDNFPSEYEKLEQQVGESRQKECFDIRHALKYILLTTAAITLLVIGVVIGAFIFPKPKETGTGTTDKDISDATWKSSEHTTLGATVSTRTIRYSSTGDYLSSTASTDDKCIWNVYGIAQEITFVNRKDGSVDFDRTWNDYQKGFGDYPDGEFWLGLDCLYTLTLSRNYSLRVEYGDFQDNDYVSIYDSFMVGSEAEEYKLSVNGYQSVNSTGGDGLWYHNRMKFSTANRDNDRMSGENCAAAYAGGGWWFNQCRRALATGKYYTGGVERYDGIVWLDGPYHFYSFKYMRFILVP